MTDPRNTNDPRDPNGTPNPRGAQSAQNPRAQQHAGDAGQAGSAGHAGPQRTPVVIKALGAFALVGLLLSVAALVFIATRPASGPRVYERDEALATLKITDFALVDQDREAFTREDLRGRVSIIDFVFTNCVGVCPGMTAEMARVQERLSDLDTPEGPVQFVSFSVDPVHDTPEVLRAFGEAFGADFASWSFLSGNHEDTERLLREGLTFELNLQLAQEIPVRGGGTMANIAHPEQMLLIGPDLVVRDMAHYTDLDGIDRLIERARALAAEID